MNNLSEIWVSLVFSKSIWPSHDEDSNIDRHSKAENWNHHLWSVKTTKISDDIGLWHSTINPHRTPQSNAAISPAPSSSSEHKATGVPKTAQTMMKITLKYCHYEFFIVSNMILVISYRNNTDKAERNPSLVYMKESLGLIFKIKWNNTKNSSRRNNSTNDETFQTFQTLFCCLIFSFLLKVSIKSTITVTDVRWGHQVMRGLLATW